MKHTFFGVLALSLALSPLCRADVAPRLKYANAGALGNWTEESYFSSPVVCDLDGDGRKEIVFSNYSVTVLDASTGKLKFRVNSGHDRSEQFSEFGKSVGHTWCSPVVADIDGDGGKEIVTAHGNGLVSVLDANGYFKPGFPVTPCAASARSLKVEDLDGDGLYEIIVGYGVESPKSLYVLEPDGSQRQGFPVLSDEQDQKVGYGYGIYMDSVAVSDLDGDGRKEIIVPTDTEFIGVFRDNGAPFEANRAIFGYDYWGQIGTYEDQAVELRGDNGGFGWEIGGRYLKREELYKLSFAHSVAVVDDVNNDGKKEVVVSALVYERNDANQYDSSKFMTVALFNTDRTRFVDKNLDADWTTLPTDRGGPLINHPEFLVSGVCQTPVIADLDGDGRKEILFNAYNGRVECFSIDKSEPFEWPYSLTKRTSPLAEYPSPVVCYDIDGDGKKEVIFTSFYDEKQPLGGIMQGSLYILNYEGRLLSKTALPKATEASSKHNGARAMPVLDDIDGDGLPEIVINTLNGAICAYDL